MRDPMIRVAIARRSVRRASRSSRNVFAIVYDASIGRRVERARRDRAIRRGGDRSTAMIRGREREPSRSDTRV